MSSDVPTLRENLDRLGVFLSRERKVLSSMFIYAMVVGLFSLIIPFTVQELVNTFAYAVTPIMVVTLIGIMAGILLFVGIFRVLQFYGTDIIERRFFVRVTLALANTLPRLHLNSFRAEYANRFFETVFMQRAFSSIFVDLINVLVGGLIGMILLVLYHPYFVIFDVLLVVSVIVIGILGKGGLRDTIKMSDAKYATVDWFQNVAENLLHFKATNGSHLVREHADSLAGEYIKARKSRFRALLRQYIGSILFQVVTHTGLLGTAGWLLSQGELTLGQLVAAEVIVASLLLNLESVMKRSYVVFYFFTALHELDHLFSLPQSPPEDATEQSHPKSESKGLHIQCGQFDLHGEPGREVKGFEFEGHPGEKWAIVCPTESIRHRVSMALAGLEPLPYGTVRYNGVDVGSLSTNHVCAERSILFSKNLKLLKGTIKDNITMRRPGIETEDLVWALKSSQLDEALNHLPKGLETPVQEEGKEFATSLVLRILLARAIVTRPDLLIINGGMHEIPRKIRQPLLSYLCSPERPWTLVITTTDPHIKDFTENVLSLSTLQK